MPPAPGRSGARGSWPSTSTGTAPCSRPIWPCASGPAPMARSPAPSCTCCSVMATRTGRILRSTPTVRASWRPTSGRARRSGRAPSPASASRRSRPSPAWWAPRRVPISAGYGFARSRNGSHNMHAALCIPAVTGAWAHEGGGAFHNNGAIYHWNRSLIEGLDVADASVRVLDQSRIGPVLTGDPADIKDGPPVTALFIQNTNPVQVAPEQRKVKAGFSREDLFACVHEQFMTATAEMADIVLPASMFLEHDDIYQGGGHQHILLGPKLIEPPGECRSNHDVICALAGRLGAEHRGFAMSPREIIDWTLQSSGWGTLAELDSAKWIDCQPPFEKAHYAEGFGYPDGKFRFKPDWANVPAPRANGIRIAADMPVLPDHWDVVEKADARHPFRLATSPSRDYLNSSFNE